MFTRGYILFKLMLRCRLRASSKLALQVMGGNLLVSLLAGFGDTFHVVYKVASWQHGFHMVPAMASTKGMFAAQPRSGLILLGPGLRLHFFLA